MKSRNVICQSDQQTKHQRRRNTQYFHHIPRMNVVKKGEAFVFEFALPGIDQNDLTVNVKEEVLIVGHQSSQDDKKKYLKKGFDLNGFERKYQLPNEVDVNQISAKYHQGILSLVLPIKETAKPKMIPIQ